MRLFAVEEVEQQHATAVAQASVDDECSTLAAAPESRR